MNLKDLARVRDNGRLLVHKPALDAMLQELVPCLVWPPRNLSDVPDVPDLIRFDDRRLARVGWRIGPGGHFTLD